MNDLKREILILKNPRKAKDLQRFFKTGKGEYGEGDLFLGITVPQQRELVKRYFDKLNLKEIQKLLDSEFHEERLIGLLILVKRFEKNLYEREKIFKFYLKNSKKVNNWDLVDLTAPNIVGNFLLDNDRHILSKLCKSKNLWKRRISIVSTYSFIRQNQFKYTIEISRNLLRDKEDLIHKAVGWMLREIGKRDVETLRKFLDENLLEIHNTTLRYSIEKMSLEERKNYLMRKRKLRSKQ